MLQCLFRPVPVAPLVYFRILFGLVMIVEVARYVGYEWVDDLFLDAEVQFKYFGFGWVRQWPGRWLDLHFLAVGALAAMMAAGALYRIAAALFFLAFSYIFLLEQSNYLNHLYLVCLLGLVMAVLPAHRALSFDALRPGRFATHVPAWTLGVLLFQIAVPYFFGGIAKVNADWLRGEPVRFWMRGANYPVVGGWPGTEPGVWFISYGGLLFDLLIVPALLWRRTRVLAVLAAAGFHLFNAIAFDIGIFPWLMLGALPLFLPLRWWERVNDRWVVATSRPNDHPVPLAVAPTGWTARRRLVAALLLAFVAVQILVPLRHWLYPGSVHWTEEGHHFAWHMMLRTKQGSATFIVSHPLLPEPVRVDPASVLTPRQQRKMSTHPDMVVQFAHHLAKDFAREGYPGAEVRADVRVALNGRPRRPLVDPAVNLAAVERTLGPADWILPLDEPLPTRRLPWRPPARQERPKKRDAGDRDES
jgi:vitamin K-dependent gamma-carboxylase